MDLPAELVSLIMIDVPAETMGHYCLTTSAVIPTTELLWKIRYETTFPMPILFQDSCQDPVGISTNSNLIIPGIRAVKCGPWLAKFICAWEHSTCIVKTKTVYDKKIIPARKYLITELVIPHRCVIDATRCSPSQYWLDVTGGVWTYDYDSIGYQFPGLKAVALIRESNSWFAWAVDGQLISLLSDNKHRAANIFGKRRITQIWHICDKLQSYHLCIVDKQTNWLRGITITEASSLLVKEIVQSNKAEFEVKLFGKLCTVTALPRVKAFNLTQWTINGQLSTISSTHNLLVPKPLPTRRLASCFTSETQQISAIPVLQPQY